jgi:hypothetical protein
MRFTFSPSRLTKAAALGYRAASLSALGRRRIDCNGSARGLGLPPLGRVTGRVAQAVAMRLVVRRFVASMNMGLERKSCLESGTASKTGSPEANNSW